MFLAAAECDGGHVIGEGSLGPWGAQGLGGPLCSGHAIYTYTSHTLKCTHAVSADITRVHTRHTCSHVYTRSPVRAHTHQVHTAHSNTRSHDTCVNTHHVHSRMHMHSHSSTHAHVHANTRHTQRVPVCARTHTMHVSHLIEPSFLHSFFHPVSLRPGAWLTRGRCSVTLSGE